MRRSHRRTLSVLIGGTIVGTLAWGGIVAAQDAGPLLLGAPPSAPAPQATLPKPSPVRTAQTTPSTQVLVPPKAAAAKPAVPAKPAATAAKPAAKPATTASATAKPAKTTKPAVPPEARRAALLAAMTGQVTPPRHDHVFEAPKQTACANPNAIGLSRVMKVDTTGGFYVGQTYHTKLPLEPMEVVLTFDDGPMAGRTDRVLKALDEECTKATFFIVGQMAKAYPETLRKTAAAGHTIGYHTMTHPLNMVKWPLPKAQENIESGWKTVDQILYGQALDHPATPFFRYPGLFNSRAINEWFNGMNMGVFAIDAAGNDWLKGYITLADGPNVMNRALMELEQQKGGILLLHDIKDSSSSIVAPLLKELKTRGFKIVQIVPKDPPPHLVSGPIKGVMPTLAETAAPLPERSIDNFDAGRQLAQQGAGHDGKTSTAPLPSYDAGRVAAVAAVPVAAVAAVPVAAVAATQATAPQATTATAGATPETTGTVPKAQPAAADTGWFSSTASSLRGLGGAMGLW